MCNLPRIVRLRKLLGSLLIAAILAFILGLMVFACLLD